MAAVTLTSSSTIEEVLAEYEDTCDYADPADVAKARRFAKACQVLLVRLPQRASHGGRGGEEIQHQLGLYENRLREARLWLDANGGGDLTSSVRHVDFRGFRD